MDKLLKKYLQTVHAHAGKLFIFYLFVAALGVWGTSKLKLSTNLNKLLPKDTYTVKTAEEASSRIGSTDFLIVAISSDKPLLNKEISDKINMALVKEIPEIAESTNRIDLSFFKKNGLLYFDIKRLKKINKQLKLVLGRKKLRLTGLLVLPENEKDPEEEKLKQLLSSRKNTAALPDELKNNARKPHELRGYLASSDGKILAVAAKPKKLAINMKFARYLVGRTQKIINRIKSEYSEPSLKIEVGGGYRNRVKEYDSIMKDVVSSFAISFLLIFLLILIFFRSLRPVPLIFIPLLTGIAVTLGLVWLSGVHRLNVITAFIGGILLGMGIDFGVHLTARYIDERGKGNNPAKSLEITLLKTGRALITAAVTTAGALYLLYFSSFRGFWEFGLIAGSGVLITLAVFLLEFPVLAVLSEKVISLKSKGFVPFTPPVPDLSAKPRKSFAILIFVILFSAVIIPSGLPRLAFETNFRRLSGHPSTGIKYGKAMGDKASPAVVMCSSVKDCSFFASYLDKRINTSLPDPDLKDFLYLDAFVPENQKEKLKIIESIKTQLKKALSWSGKDKKLTDKIKTMIKYLPSKKFTVADLPENVRLRFTEKNGDVGKFLYIYPARETWNAEEAEILKEKFASINLKKLPGAPPDAGHARSASSSFILTDIIKIVKKEGVLIFIAALFMVFFLLLADFKSFASALIVFFPLVLGLLWTASLMPILGQKPGLYNMVVLSTIVGTGIDSAVHLYHGFKENISNPYEVLLRNGMSVSVAALTTLVGFSGMMLANHGGLSSIGRLAFLGILISLISSLLIIPSLYFILNYFKSKKSVSTD